MIEQVTEMQDAQKKDAVMTANHLAQLKAVGAAVLVKRAFVVKMGVLVKGEEEVDGQSLWIYRAMTVEVLEEDPYWTTAFLEFHP